MTMLDAIKSMDKDELAKFVYWVYCNGVYDGRDNLMDDFGFGSYFGGHVLDVDSEDCSFYTFYDS